MDEGDILAKMKYVALFRGINVGGNRRVEMKKLRELFESLGCSHVSTYLNSGNLIFERTTPLSVAKLQSNLENAFGFSIDTLVKTHTQMRSVAQAIPNNWTNDLEWKTDIAYLFPAIDSPEILNLLPVRKEFLELRYVPGAAFWRVERKNIHKTNLNKLVGTKLYAQMTLRNVNTARFLGQ